MTDWQKTIDPAIIQNNLWQGMSLPIVAHHEAGHAVMRMSFEWPPPAKLSIVPEKGQYAGVAIGGFPRGHSAILRDILGQVSFENKPAKRRMVELLIMGCLAGAVAQNCHQKMKNRYLDAGCQDDMEMACCYAKAITPNWPETRALVMYLRVKTRLRLLQPEPWKRVETIAKALLERGSMKREEILSIYRSATIASEAERLEMEESLRPLREW